jgi:hypothetical protein
MQIQGISNYTAKTGVNTITLHCLKYQDGAFGLVCDWVSFPIANVKSYLGKDIAGDEWKSLVGAEIMPYYDRRGTLQEIRFADVKSA